MLKVTPNFHFRGQGKQAIELYKKAFGAEVKILYCNSDAHPKDCALESANQGDLIYHAEIYIGQQRITLTDTPDDPIPNTNPLSLLITFETAKAVKKAYEIMKEGATIIYPIQTTTYSSCFVSLIDKFGMRWELMTEQTEK
ncbi:MAG: glyoxalase/bleomycin resistance/extradiol dioxygenase family protein [Erysipelotrichales bacterium]|nr:glyoxalase/bleomycin resistance/extradiol dioxygenase family protein [Erysipelotrichales bacterium]